MLHIWQWISTHIDTLAKLAVIANSITIVFLFITLILMRKQGRAAYGASALQVFEQIYTDLNSNESRNNRQFIYNHKLLPKEIIANDVVHRKVESVCVSLDRVGVMLTNRLLPKGPARKIYFDMYVDVFIRCWESLKDYVEYMRERRTPQHYRNFESLADQAKEYWREEFEDVSLDKLNTHKRKRYHLSQGQQNLITRSTRIICDKPETWFRVRLDEVENTDSKELFNYTIAEIGPSVGIVAVDDNERIRIVGQWRYTLNKYSWELPTGAIKNGEHELKAAKRELFEETGLKAGNWIKLGTIDNSNGSTTDVGHLFLASVLTQFEAQRDINEVLEMDSVSLWEALELVYENKITESLSVAAILKAGHYLATQSDL